LTFASGSKFAYCSGGEALYVGLDRCSLFLRCCFVKNGVGLTNHGPRATGCDIVQYCFFEETDVCGATFVAGSVLLEDCGFAEEVPSLPRHCLTTGIQQRFTGMTLVFVEESGLPTCAENGVFVVTAAPAPVQPRDRKRRIEEWLRSAAPRPVWMYEHG
jgi:hypothetical protein